MKALFQNLSASFLSAAFISAATAENIRSNYRDWQICHGDCGGIHYSELDQINRSNVTKLEVAWIRRADDIGRTIEANPITLDAERGIVFMGTGSPANDNFLECIVHR